MREILFRGKAFDTKEWVEGSLYLPKLEEESGFAWILGKNEERTLVLLETVGQFTGLLDKNGKKVFEGDILASSLDWREVGFSTVEAVYSKELLCFALKFKSGNLMVAHGLESLLKDNPSYVVGNVWDNAEMIEPKV